MPTADLPLIQQIQHLQAWLQTLDFARSGRAPSWSKVLLAEDSEIAWTESVDDRPKLSHQSLRTPVEFDSRWNELVAEGRTTWINLSAHGVWNGFLVVLVEVPRQGIKGTYRPEQISVNCSGPPLDSEWDLRHLVIT